MLDKLMAMLRGDPRGGEAEVARDLEVAVAALLVEAGRMDQRFDAGERAVIERLLAERFELDAQSVVEVLERAEAKAADSEQYYPFTQKICDRLSGPERVAVIEMLWQVAYADGRLDAYEDALVRQVASLIHVDDRARAQARQRALAALGINRPGEA